MIKTEPVFYGISVRYVIRPQSNKVIYLSSKERKEWQKKIEERFPKFDRRRYKTEQAAKMAAGKIIKIFPDAPLEIYEGFDLYF